LRIIGGIYKGRHISVPRGFKARPTTDFAREGLFNILTHQVDLNGLRVLDLFGGTGSISLEFASRGAASIDFVETDYTSCKFLRKTISSIGIENIHIHRTDALKYLKHTPKKFDLVFADPPYEMESIPEIPGWIFDNEILKKEGVFILEHGGNHGFSNHPKYRYTRSYGSVNFSFFDMDR
jgi:16S rRNA (guanine(966)-N(2))-methyltransferase RsmD